MWRTRPKVLSCANIEIVEVKCPINGDHRLEPQENNNWLCLDCGMEFRTNYEGEQGSGF